MLLDYWAGLRLGKPYDKNGAWAATGVVLDSLDVYKRQSLDRVSVPVWLVVLSDQLQIVALVGLYPTN